MKVVVIGATGIIGGAVAGALKPGHEVMRASRSGELRVDLADHATVESLLSSLDGVHAVVCCAANAPLTPLRDPGFRASMEAKLFGQVELVRVASERLSDGGSITLTAGQIPEATPGSAAGALVNAGLEAFVRAAAVEMPRGVRLNAISPGWVKETLAALGMDEADGIPVSEVARAYVETVEGAAHGQVVTPGRPDRSRAAPPPGSS